MRYPKNRFHPITYQGQGRKGSYFEGWYYKAVTADGRSLAFIPGISLGTDPHCFVQVTGPSAGLPRSYRYPVDAFQTADHPFSVTIGNNRFTAGGLQIDLNDGHCPVQGRLHYRDPVSVHSHLLWPNSMGPFAWLPRMECNHGVLYLDARVSGQVRIGPEILSFDQDAGYLEKDWGRSFPRSYLWLQCNSFKTQPVSLMLSVARIPVGPGSFTGILGFVQHDSAQYRFSSYNGTRLTHLELRPDRMDLTLQHPRYRLNVRASRADGSLLDAPVHGDMAAQIRETLDSTVSLRLTGRQHQLLLDANGSPAGLEIVEGLHNR